MIDIKELYAATNNGKDIILSIFPDVKEGKPFSTGLRTDTEPSASLWQNPKTKRWGVTDFGSAEGNGKQWSDAVQVWQDYKHVSSRPEAICMLGEFFNVPDSSISSSNKPDIKTETAKEDEPDGYFDYCVKESFTDYELKVMGPNVKQEHCDELHWQSLAWYSQTKDGKTTTRYSTDTYPIFMRTLPVEPSKPECHKIYEPLNPEKRYRFRITPIGTYPQSYVHGLAELKEAFAELNAKEKAKWEQKEDKKDGEEYQERKLPAVAIVSGDRDALCCLSMGVHPVYLSSETAELPDSLMKLLEKLTSRVFLIPDIDETGKKVGRQLALRFPELQVVWLPRWLRERKDSRGKPRKDLRDWMELRPGKEDFKNLLKTARCIKFWTDKGEGPLNMRRLLHFLNINGFYTLDDEYRKDTIYIKVNKPWVSELQVKDVKSFTVGWLEEKLSGDAIINQALNSTKFSSGNLEVLKSVELNFKSHTPTSQLFYMRNCVIEVTAENVKMIPNKDFQFNNYVWENSIIKHDFRELPEPFTISAEQDANGNPTFDISVNDTSSPLLGYLINSSRTYWRKELEENLAVMTAEEREAYKAAHKFDIAGEGLSEEEIQEQKQTLLNKLYVLGYLLHRQKDPSRAMAPIALDNRIGDEGQCNGRSGKSIFFSFIGQILPMVTLDGGKMKPKENKHIYEKVSPSTNLILIDDCQKDFNLNDFYADITGGLDIDVKHEKSFTLPFSSAPKFALTTNFVPMNFDPSTTARLLPMVFGDYYHIQTEENDYLESRSVRDDFEQTLWDEYYSEESWQQDLCVAMYATHFYLFVNKNWPSYRIMPPMKNITRRKYKHDMGENFEEWANMRLCPGSGWLDEKVEREVMTIDYITWSGIRITAQGFKKKLRAFVKSADWIAELNPDDVEGHQKDGRIIIASKEYFYIRSEDPPF